MFGADLGVDLLAVVWLDLGYCETPLVEVGMLDWCGLMDGMVEL